MLRARTAFTSVAVVALVGVASVTGSTAAVAADRGSAKSYSVQKIAGSVVRWNPCESIHYRVNTTSAPTGALSDTKAAVARIATATGMTFVYDGPTTVIPTRAGQNAEGNTGLTIAWANTKQSDLLKGGKSVGEGGWNATYVVAAKTGAISDVHIRNGFVVIDTASNKSLPGGFADKKYGTRGELLQHELGHAVGLQHVTDKNQLMYETLGSHSSLGAGDKAGLKKVGKAAGCTK